MKKPAKKASTVKAKAPAPPGADERVRLLLHLTGAGALGKQIIDSMMDNFNRQGNLPPGFVDKFKERAEAVELIELLVPIYMRHLDRATLESTIGFFASAAGKSFSAAQPGIVRESTVAGQQWGMELAQRAMRALEEDAKGIG